MKKETKKFLVSFLVSGGVYAVLMMLWDVIKNEETSLGKFLFFFISFGLFMGFFAVYNHRKSLRKKDNGKNESN